MCTSPQCPGYKKRIWIPIGFGHFNMARVINDSECRVCKGEATDINNIGYFMTKIVVCGKKKNSKEKFNF